MKINIRTTAALSTLALCSLALTPSCSREPSPSLVLLNLELPHEMSIGTNADLSHITHLPQEEHSTEFRPPSIKIPETSILLSRGKPVTSSDKEEPFEGELSMITDGEKDGNEGFSVMLSAGPQWVQIDLEQEALIDAVVVWHYFMQQRVVFDVIVQVSNDPEFENGVTTIFNNDIIGETSALAGTTRGTDDAFVGNYHGRQLAANGARGRFVRLWSNGNSDNRMNEYIEVEVFGRPIQ